jgi:hypothetical protein
MAVEGWYVRFVYTSDIPEEEGHDLFWWWGWEPSQAEINEAAHSISNGITGGLGVDGSAVYQYEGPAQET